MREIRNSKGLSMVELLIVATVGAVAGFLLIYTLIQSNDVFFRETGRVKEGLSLNDAVSVINQDIKSAGAVSANYPESGQIQYQTSDEVLVLKTPSIDSSGNIIEDSYDYTILYKDADQPAHLLRKVVPTPPSQKGAEQNVLLKNLNKVKFLYLDKNGNFVSPTSAEKINFFINVKTNFGLNSQISSSSGEVNLRND